MNELALILSAVAGCLCGILAAGSFFHWRLQLAIMDEMPIEVDQSFFFLVDTKRLNHLQICELRCQRLDAQRSTISEAA